MNDGILSQDSVVLHPLAHDNCKKKSSDSISKISNASRSCFVLNSQEVQDMRFCGDHPAEKVDCVKRDTGSFICKICAVRLKSWNSSVLLLSEVQEINTLKAYHLEKMIQRCNEGRDHLAKALQNKKDNLKEIIRDEFNAKRKQLEDMEKEIDLQIDRCDSLDQLKLKDLGERISCLQRNLTSYRENAEYSRFEETFIKDNEEKENFQEIIKLEGSIVSQSAVISLETELMDMLNQFEYSFLGIKQSLKTYSFVIKDDRNENDQEGSQSLAIPQKREYNSLEDQLELIGMKSHLSYEEASERMFLCLRASGECVIQFLDYYRQLKARSRILYWDLILTADLIIKETAELHRLTCVIDLDSIAEEREDLSKVLDYPFENKGRLVKKLYMIIPPPQYNIRSDPLTCIKRFLRRCKYLEEVAFTLEISKFTNTVIQNIIEECFSLNERFSLFKFDLRCHEQTNNISIVISTIIKMLKSYSVILNSIKADNVSLILSFNLIANAAGIPSKVFEVCFPYFGFMADSRNVNDLILQIAKAICSSHSLQVEEMLAKKKGVNTVLAFIEKHNMF